MAHVASTCAPGFMFWWLRQGPQWRPWSHSTFPTCNEVQIEKCQNSGSASNFGFSKNESNESVCMSNSEISRFFDTVTCKSCMMCFCCPTCHQRWKHQITHHETSRRQWNRLRTFQLSCEAMANHERSLRHQFC